MKRCIFIMLLLMTIIYPGSFVKGAETQSGEALVFMMEKIYRAEDVKTSEFYELTDVEYICSDGQYNYYSCDTHFNHLIYSVEDVISDMNNTGIFEKVERDIEFHDEAYGDRLDTLLNPGIANQWYLDTINAKKAWEYVGGEPGKGVVVAVIDSGINYSHKDLQENIWKYNQLSNLKDINDNDGHGTHVSGIIGMVADNYRGGAGVAYSAEIMPVKAGDSNDGTFLVSDVIAALDYAVKNGADVINMSFGSPKESDVFKTALENASKTCVLVAAAGNEGNLAEDVEAANAENIYPAAYPFVLGVMATDKDNSILSWSNYDEERFTDNEYELAAPGKEIYSTYLSGNYKYMNGTSMATPMVSGAAAILIQNARNNGIKNIAEYVFLQLRSASYPLLDIYEALTTEPEVNVVVNNFRETYADNIVSCGFDIRNTWKEANNVSIKLTVAADEQATPILMTDDIIRVGSMAAGEVYSIEPQGNMSVKIAVNAEPGESFNIPVKFDVAADDKIYEYTHNIIISKPTPEPVVNIQNNDSTNVDIPGGSDIGSGNESAINPQKVKGIKVKVKKINSKKRKNIIKWKKTKDAQKYVIYYAKSRNGKYRKLAVVSKPSYTHIVKKKKTKFFYKIRAVYVQNEEKIYGPYSKVVKK